MVALLALLLPSVLAAEPRSLTVEEAIALLEAHSPAVARAEAQVEQLDGARLVALSASLPSLVANGAYVRNNAEVELALGQLMDALAALTGQSASGDTPDSILLQPLDSLSGNLALKVPLITPSAWASAGAAARSAQASEANADAVRSTTRGAALQAFWLAAAAEAMVEAAERSVERARALVVSAERSVAVGTATRLSLLQAQTDLARREGELLSSRAALTRARLAAGALLGLSEPVVVTLVEPSVVAAQDPDQLVTLALERRAELLAAEAQVEAARLQRLSARLGYVPSLSGSFTAFASNVAYSTGDKTGWRASLDLSWPLVSGGARLGTARRSEGAFLEAEAALRAVELQVTQQVQLAVVDADVAAQRREQAARQLELAEEGARVAQRSFDEGLVDSAAVLDALDRLDRARASQIDAVARLGLAGIALQTATGEW